MLRELPQEDAGPEAAEQLRVVGPTAHVPLAVGDLDLLLALGLVLADPTLHLAGVALNLLADVCKHLGFCQGRAAGIAVDRDEIDVGAAVAEGLLDKGATA